MSSYRIISSDNHITEPPDLWISRAEPKFKDRVPQVMDVDGSEQWVCEGKAYGGVGGGSGEIGFRFEDPGSMGMKLGGELRKGGWIPEEHIKDLDIDGVDISIIYPTIGSLLYNVPDSLLMDYICKAYNDWTGEFCGAFPKRLKGIAMLNVDDVGVGVKELERAHKMGFTGAMIPCYPPEDRLYNQPMYDPLWAAAQDLGMPLGLHISSNRNDSEFGSTGELQADVYMQRRLLAEDVPVRPDIRRSFREVPRPAGRARWSTSCRGCPTSWTGWTIPTRNGPGTGWRNGGSRATCYPATISTATCFSGSRKTAPACGTGTSSAWTTCSGGRTIPTRRGRSPGADRSSRRYWRTARRRRR